MNLDKTEKRYIAKRRRKAFLHSIPFYVCRIFLIKKKKIVFWSYKESQGYC